jgi:hypothetical protein
MMLAHGATNTGDGGQRSIRFNGHSLDDSNFTFNGIDTSGVQEQTQKADTRLNISTDAVDEFRVSSAVPLDFVSAALDGYGTIERLGDYPEARIIWDHLQNALDDAIGDGKCVVPVAEYRWFLDCARTTLR